MNTDNRFFDGTQTVIGHGAQADVYSYHGYAYKVYRPTYNPEWIKFEKAQQSVVNATGLCNVRYYDTEDLYTVKMDLVEGETLEKKILAGFEGGFDILAAMFRKVHSAELDGVKMPGLIDTAGFGVSDENRQKILPVIVRLSEKMDSCICHLDLHFLNIMMPFDGSEPVIIAEDGDPAPNQNKKYEIRNKRNEEVRSNNEEFDSAGDSTCWGKEMIRV